MSSPDVMTTIVCTTTVAANIRELSRRLGKQDLDGMFLTQLSATGNLPATHYISSGYIRPAYLNAMTDSVRLFTVAKKAWEDDGDIFPFTQLQVTDKLALCSVINGTHGDALTLISSLGLKIIERTGV